MSTRDDIEQLLYRYAECVDTGNFDGVSALFAHGGFGSGDSRAYGSQVGDNMKASVLTYDGVPSTKHVTTNLIVEADEGADSARARSYFTVFQWRPGFPMQPVIGGRYHDRFERVDGRWRFADREVICDLFGDLSHHLQPGILPSETRP